MISTGKLFFLLIVFSGLSADLSARMVRHAHHERSEKDTSQIIDPLQEKNNMPLVLSSSKDSSANTQRDYRVRVLLHEADRSMPPQWKVSGTTEIFLVDSDTKTKHKLKTNKLTIGFKNKKFLVNNEPLDSKRFYLIPSEGNLSLEGKEFQGYLLFSFDANSVYAMNSIDIEEYVCSVLLTESWPGWPLEVNKALAIASRSYVIGVIFNNKPTTPYHVKNTNKHQTYSGVHSNPVLKEAVAQTKGMFLADQKNKPIVAMFDSCCGGVIPAHIHGVDFTNAPYLARPYACTYCKDCRVYNWSIQYPHAHLEKTLKKELKQLKNMQIVKISKTDKAGLVQQVSVKGKHASHQLSGKKLYSLLPKVRSFYFDIETNKTHIKISGKGVGHHLGLCQWGAREMIAQGYDYKSVLSFYYPGTHFMRLS